MKRLIANQQISTFKELLQIDNKKILEELSQAFLTYVKNIDLEHDSHFTFTSGVGMMFRQSDKNIANPLHLTQILALGSDELSQIFNNILQKNGIDSNCSYDGSDSPLIQKLINLHFNEFKTEWKNILLQYEEKYDVLPDDVTDVKNAMSIRDFSDIDDKVGDIYDVDIPNYAGATSRSSGFSISNGHIYDSHIGATHMDVKQNYPITDEDKDDGYIFGITMGKAGIITKTTDDEETTIKKVQNAYKKSDVNFKIYYQTNQGLLRIANKCHKVRLINKDLKQLLTAIKN